MTQSSKPSGAFKVLAVAGFLALIGLLLWLAVVLVAALPGAFASLASIFEGLQDARPRAELVVTNSSSVVNSDETFTVRWSDLNRAGVYTIRIECTEGVSVDMHYPAENITTIPCGETIRLGSDLTSLELTAHSERQRFTDIPYTIGFISAGEAELFTQTDHIITVVNVNIPQGAVAGVSNDENGEEDTPEEVTDGTAETPEPEQLPTEQSQPAVRTVATEVYELPSSDPNGYVDLAVQYLGVGRLNEDNEFIPRGTIDQDTRGAFQFEVRNIGTKTSPDWTYEAILTSGQTYESEKQDGLRPNEYQVVTIGFDAVGDTGARRFGAEVDVRGDTNRNNDSFSWAVNVVD